MENIRSTSKNQTRVISKKQVHTTSKKQVHIIIKKQPDVPPPPHTDSDEDSEETSESEESDEDEEGIVSVGDRFVHSDEEEGDSTFIVSHITRSDWNRVLCVWEDDESLCLTHVRKKVTTLMITNTTRGSRRSTRTIRKINYDENINLWIDVNEFMWFFNEI